MWWQDVTFGARRLVKDRKVTAAAVAALALGIGANAAVFTLVNAVVVRGLPFDDAHRIMAVWTENERRQSFGVSELDFEDWRAQTRAFSDLAAFLGSTVNLSDAQHPPERVQGAYVTGNFFRLIGQTPVLGRSFTEADDRPGAEPVTLLGHRVWQSRYGGDENVVGRVMRANSKLVTVIGVMPPDLRFPNNADIWIPRGQLPPESLTGRRDTRNLAVIGRLAADVSVARAQVELDTIGERLAQTYPETNADLTPVLEAFHDRVNSRELELVFWSLQGAVTFVLLIACANVANLLLARSARRRGEISVRVALGASRWRIVRQLLVESLLLALVAGVAGMGLAAAGVQWFDAATQNVGKPYWMEFTMDGTVLAFIAAVCLSTTLLFGLAPAWQIANTHVHEVLKEGGRTGTGGRRARRWTGVLVAAEVALTIVLLAGAGYMMRSFLTLYALDLGIDTSRLLTMRVYLPLTQYPDAAPRAEVFRQFEARLGAIGAVETSTFTTAAPLGGGGVRALEIDGRPAPVDGERPTITTLSVGDHYFETLNVSLLQGRAFDARDGLAGRDSAIVNQRFVTTHFAETDPLGHRIRLANPIPSATEPEAAWLAIVGIAPNIRQRDVQDPEPDPVVYLPHRRESPRQSVLILRALGDPTAVTTAVREALQRVEPDLPLYDVRTMDEALAQQRWPYRVFGSMFAVFAVVALLLSGIGLYSVTAYAVTQRTREIGLRVALGAQAAQVRWLVLRRGFVQVAVGLALGMVGAYGVGRLLESLLVQMHPTDPTTLGAVVFALVAVALTACLWPAQRAARLDPVIALRDE